MNELPRNKADPSAELVELEAYINDLWRFLPVPIAYVTPLGVIVDVDQSLERLLDYPRDEIVGRLLDSFCTQPGLAARLAEYAAHHELAAIPACEIVRHGGSVIPVRMSALARLDESAEKIGYFVAFFDLTDLHSHEKTIRASEAKYRAVVEQSADNVFIVDLATRRITQANPAMSQLLGYSPEELLRLTIYDFVDHPRSDIDERIRQVEEQGHAFFPERRYRRRDNTAVDVEVSVSLIRYSNLQALSVVSRDISERLNAQRTQRLVYRLSELINTTRDLPDLYRAIHAELSQAIDTTNFYIAIYEPQHDLLHFPYFVDELHHYETIPAGNTLTAYVIKNNLPLLIDEAGLEEMARTGKAQMMGKYSKVWMGVPLKVRDEVIGAMAVQSYSDPKKYSDRDLKLMRFVSDQVAMAIERKQAQQHVVESLARLQKLTSGAVDAIARISETRDPYTAGHQKRTAELARSIARAMDLPDEQIASIHMSAIIHDIGKIHIPAEILVKPTELSDVEFEIVRTHSQIGHDILQTIDFPWPVAAIVLAHHERLNGTGYPNGIKGDAICLEARVLAVADVVEAMSSYRPYRPARGMEATMKELENNRGTLYDPAVVDACLRLFREEKFKFE